MDWSSKKETFVTKGFIERQPFTSNNSYSWSPDNKWIAFAGFAAKSFRNIYVVPATGGEGKAISFLANAFSGGVSWSKDGKYILFNTAQRTENGYVARVDLVPQSPRFKEDQFQSLFVEQTPANPATTNPTPNKTTAPVDTMFKSTSKNEKEPVKINWNGLRQRMSFVPLGIDANEYVISPDGNTLVVIGSAAGQTNIFSYTLDELSKEPAVLKQITSTPSFKSSPQFSPDGKEVFFIEQGRIQSVVLDSRQVKALAVTAELDIDFSRERLEVFKQAWELENNGFYDPAFHGANWSAIKNIYEPLAAGANTPEELRRILSMMVGELNASHSGVSGPPAQLSVGKLGLRYDNAEYEKNGRLKITQVISLGPADLSDKIHAGDYLTAIDGVAIIAESNVDQLLENKTGKMVTLTIGSASDKEGKKVTVRPVSTGIEKGLLYKQLVQQQRDYVNNISKGRLGYVHMFDMGQESLDQLYIDMDAENHSREGVVVDIRNNNGGFVNAYALDVLSRKGYMTMTVRGLPSAPARVQLGQRALDAPTILVTNQHSLSDAEDFSEGYRTLKLGKIVGEPTGGWIIYTSNISLFDGTNVRLPFIKITDHEGKNMELNPRPVDIAISNPLGEKNKDSQLDVAVKELLKQIDGSKGEAK
jgi:C-terminal processing protease CtpA/Prc